VFAAVIWASGKTPEPTFVAPSAQDRAQTAKSRPAPSGTSKPAPPTTAGPSSSGTANRRPTAKARVRRAPLASGGYVFGRGALVADPRGKTVTLTLWRGCASGAGTPALPVAGGRFSYDGASRGKKKVRLSVSGRFVNASTARVRIVLRGPGCAKQPTTVVARLS
jgi:hypothetical protein